MPLTQTPMTSSSHEWHVEQSQKNRIATAFAVGAIVWAIGYAYLLLRPDMLLTGIFFLFEDGGQYLWVVDQLEHGKHLFKDIHWYYGMIPLWTYQAWVALLGNSARTFAIYGIAQLTVNAGLAFWWLSRLIPRNWAVTGVLLVLAPWLLRNMVQAIHVPWEVTSMLLLACSWKPMVERTPLHQWLLGLLLVITAMVKLPLIGAGAIALMATDIAHFFLIPTSSRFVLTFVANYWRTILSSSVGLAFYFLCLFFAAGDAKIWYDTALPFYMIKAYAGLSPVGLSWEGISFFVINQLPVIISSTASAGLVVWTFAFRRSSNKKWILSGGLFLPLAMLLSPLTVIRTSSHLNQYYWMGLMSVAICLPLLQKRVRYAAIAVMLAIASDVPYKMFFKPTTRTLTAVGRNQSLWLTEEQRIEWTAINQCWETHRSERRKSMIIMTIGGGTYFYAQIPQNFRHYYYYPGFVRPYDLDWLVAHQNEFSGVLITGSPAHIARMMAKERTIQTALNLDFEVPDHRISLGTPDRFGERCLFLPFLPTTSSNIQ